MSTVAAEERPRFDHVMDSLKDFQRRTVDYVFARMYRDADAVRRFLVADEVGLGKTLVARGLIARVIEELWDDVRRIDVVYICSNAEIARQNIARLDVMGSGEDGRFAHASRITMLPKLLPDLASRRVNFVSFTPTTSFDLQTSLGMAEERVLLYWLLREAWQLGDRAGPMNVLQGNVKSSDSFRERIDCFDRSAVGTSLEAFRDVLAQRPHLRERFDDLCSRFGRARVRIPQEDAIDRSRLVGELRGLLARTCLAALEPDLVILDEFQRFKNLLGGESEAAQLARELFDYSRGAEKARVVLLSATPYKMYTTHDEAGEDQHYEDFLRTLEFLFDDASRVAEIKGLIERYRKELYRVGNEPTPLAGIKQDLEDRLRRVMVRTERLAVSADRNGMLLEVRGANAQVTPSDLEGYLDLQRLARQLEHPDTLEYWKSAPYLVNFMDDYDLKRKLLAGRDDQALRPRLARELARASGSLLQWNEIAAYERVDPKNARLRWLFADTVDRGTWKLLWIPPSLPYYRPGGPFETAGLSAFTKRLVFSAWRVVPKAIATLLSYEAERQIFRSFDDRSQNTPEARKAFKPLLRFARSEGRLTGMPIFSIIYPSFTLARSCDPVALTDGPETSGDEILARATEQVQHLLAGLPPGADTGPEDETWYWAAPVLLDLVSDEPAARAWLTSSTDRKWTGDSGAEVADEDGESSFAQHVELLRSVAAGEIDLGRQPDDLAEVIAKIGLAAPGVAALRALSRATGAAENAGEDAVRDAAARIAWGFRSLFQLPEVTALIRGLGSGDAYWRRTLDYCVQGCLQAVLDEYLHVLPEALGVDRKPFHEVAAEVASAVVRALSVRTASLSVDEVAVARSRRTYSFERRRLRSRFAARLGDEDADEGGEPTRADQVRAAFNSPFWPFVLASTSIGQEGLDFHLYCHALVHWNLPSNPVDLEQREGRVHRYKGHAVRKNLALQHGPSVLRDHPTDPWKQLFAAAQADRQPSPSTTPGAPHSSSPLHSDLVPFWLCPVPEGGARIERLVPAVHLSADLDRLEALRRSLVLYRMVFGQARQDELVAFLEKRLPSDQIEALVNDLRIDLAPPDLSWRPGPARIWRHQ